MKSLCPKTRIILDDNEIFFLYILLVGIMGLDLSLRFKKNFTQII